MGDTDVETLSNVSKGKYDFAYSEFDKVSSDAKDFISRLLVTDKKYESTFVGYVFLISGRCGVFIAFTLYLLLRLQVRLLFTADIT